MCYVNLLLTFECLRLIVSTSSNCFEAVEDCVDFVDYFRHFVISVLFRLVQLSTQLKCYVLRGYRPAGRGGFLNHTEPVLCRLRASADVPEDCSR